MIDVRIEEWLDPGEIRGDELRATFARLNIRLGDRIATQVIDTRSGSLRDAVFVPAYPLAEWLSRNWWHLLYGRVPSERDAKGLERVCLRYAAEGYALPDIRFTPLDPGVRIQCLPRTLHRQPLSFVSECDAWCTVTELSTVLRQFFKVVLDRLSDMGCRKTVFEDTVGQIDRIDDNSDQSEFCRLAAKLGIDPMEEEDDSLLSAIEQGSERLEFGPLAELMAASDREHLVSDLEWLEAERRDVAGARAGAKDVQQFRAELNVTSTGLAAKRPWAMGYEIARRVRRVLNLNGTLLPDTRMLRQRLHIPEEAVHVMTHDNPRVVAVVDGISSDAGPRFLTKDSREEARRFALARAYFECLTAINSDLALTTKYETYRQKASRAFAAELLAPAQAVDQLIPNDRRVDQDDLIGIAEACGVSTEVIRHQIENHSLATLVF
jgi:hypothetical protein